MVCRDRLGLAWNLKTAQRGADGRCGIHVCTLSAQCYPRHACPVCASLLMQLHSHSKTAPLLALLGVSVLQKLMRIHARYACMALLQFRAPEFLDSERLNF